MHIKVRSVNSRTLWLLAPKKSAIYSRRNEWLVLGWEVALLSIQEWLVTYANWLLSVQTQYDQANKCIYGVCTCRYVLWWCACHTRHTSQMKSSLHIILYLHPNTQQHQTRWICESAATHRIGQLAEKIALWWKGKQKRKQRICRCSDQVKAKPARHAVIHNLACVCQPTLCKHSSVQCGGVNIRGNRWLMHLRCWPRASSGPRLPRVHAAAWISPQCHLTGCSRPPTRPESHRRTQGQAHHQAPSVCMWIKGCVSPGDSAVKMLDAWTVFGWDRLARELHQNHKTWTPDAFSSSKHSSNSQTVQDCEAWSKSWQSPLMGITLYI